MMETVIKNLEEKIKNAFIMKCYYNAIASKNSDEAIKNYYLTRASKYKLRMEILSETIELVKENTKY